MRSTALFFLAALLTWFGPSGPAWGQEPFRRGDANDDGRVNIADGITVLGFLFVGDATLGCRDAGRVDLRCDAQGEVHFLEVNPLAGLNPSDSDLPILGSLVGLNYRELIRTILDSAAERMTC